jgi:hypothetical protein
MSNIKEKSIERLQIDIPIRNDNPFDVVNNLSPTWGIMLTMQSNLNLRIGTQIWKKYINATFWNYISTPINFTITLFSALSAGQTGTGSSYLNNSQLFYILFITFVLSIANTFFNLKEKAKINYESAKIYESFGYDFEKIYFIPVLTDEDLDIKLNYYRLLQERIDNQSSKESIEYANYITELIFIITKYCCCANFNFNKLSHEERFWLLDGNIKTHRYYYTNTNSYNVDMSIFKEDFSAIDNNSNNKIKNLQTINSNLTHEILELKNKIHKLEESHYLKFIDNFFKNMNNYMSSEKTPVENKNETGVIKVDKLLPNKNVKVIINKNDVIIENKNIDNNDENIFEDSKKKAPVVDLDFCLKSKNEIEIYNDEDNNEDENKDKKEVLLLKN